MLKLPVPHFSLRFQRIALTGIKRGLMSCDGERRFSCGRLILTEFTGVIQGYLTHGSQWLSQCQLILTKADKLTASLSAVIIRRMPVSVTSSGQKPKRTWKKRTSFLNKWYVNDFVESDPSPQSLSSSIAA